MPEQASLDRRLAQGRADLLDEIEQPPLAAVTARATGLRRRRQVVRAGAAALAVLAISTLGARALSDQAGPDRPDQLATQPPAPVPTYAGGGITIEGLTEDRGPDLPGTITDVEFTDPDHGYLVIAACRGLAPCFARTTDGGRTWAQEELPAGLVFDGGRADLIAFSGERFVGSRQKSAIGWTRTTFTI